MYFHYTSIWHNISKYSCDYTKCPYPNTYKLLFITQIICILIINTNRNVIYCLKTSFWILERKISSVPKPAPNTRYQVTIPCVGRLEYNKNTIKVKTSNSVRVLESTVGIYFDRISMATNNSDLWYGYYTPYGSLNSYWCRHVYLLKYDSICK